MTFTDNADDAVSGDAARAETVLGLAPFVALTASGQRHELTFDGRLELTRFVDEDRTTVDPDASVRTRSVLVDRLATLETVARVSQRAADGNPLADDDFRLDGDREETWELGITPSLESELGDRSRIRGEYRFATVRSSDEERIGSDTHAIASRLDTVLTGSGAFAFVGTDSARVRFEDGSSGRTASIGLGVGRPFGRTVVGGGDRRSRLGEGGGRVGDARGHVLGRGAALGAERARARDARLRRARVRSPAERLAPAHRTALQRRAPLVARDLPRRGRPFAATRSPRRSTRATSTCRSPSARTVSSIVTRPCRRSPRTRHACGSGSTSATR